MRASCRASWQSPSWSSQCLQSFRSYFGMSAWMGATVINKVVVGASLVGTGVDVAVGGTGVEIGAGVSLVAVGVGGGGDRHLPGYRSHVQPAIRPGLG